MCLNYSTLGHCYHSHVSASCLNFMMLLLPTLGDDIKTEAWVLRNLITVLATAARRPHTPRSPEMRQLFRAIGIDVSDSANGPLVAKSICHFPTASPMFFQSRASSQPRNKETIRPSKMVQRLAMRLSIVKRWNLKMRVNLWMTLRSLMGRPGF